MERPALGGGRAGSGMSGRRCIAKSWGLERRLSVFPNLSLTLVSNGIAHGFSPYEIVEAEQANSKTLVRWPLARILSCVGPS